MDYKSASIKLHEQYKGKLSVSIKVPIENKEDLSLAYSPGVAGPSLEIASNKHRVKDLTWRSNTIAVISDGSAVLGLGNIGPEAALPVMEGKCVLFKKFANVDAVPIVVDTQEVDKFIQTIINIAPSFSGINLEDISAPRCFEIEERLQDSLDIPVFHDDQHGTAIVILAALINAGKVLDLDIRKEAIVTNGAGSAATAAINLLHSYGFKDMIVVDSKGIIDDSRADLEKHKLELVKFTNLKNQRGNLADAVKDRKIFLGLSVADVLTSQMIKTMQKDPVIVAMANPNPEIMPELAKEAGARIIATGRSDYPNQVNNVLGFPGIFRGLLDNNIKKVTVEMKIRAAEAIASLVPNPTEEEIIPSPFHPDVANVVADSIRE